MLYIEKDRVTDVGKLLFKTREEAEKYYADLDKWVKDYLKEGKE